MGCLVFYGGFENHNFVFDLLTSFEQSGLKDDLHFTKSTKNYKKRSKKRDLGVTAVCAAAECTWRLHTGAPGPGLDIGNV